VQTLNFFCSKETAEGVTRILEVIVPTSQKARSLNPSKWKDALRRILLGRGNRLNVNNKPSLKGFIQNGKYQNVF
jgi:hypothetical protein